MEGRSLRLAEPKVCQGSQSTRGIAATDSNRGEGRILAPWFRMVVVHDVTDVGLDGGM